MSASDAAIVARWRVRLKIREALLAHARRSARFWSVRHRSLLRREGGGKSTPSADRRRAYRNLKAAQARVHKREGQVSDARRVIARHSHDRPIPARGIDVSNHQGTGIDWKAVHGAGYRFAWLKASEGRSFTDATFLRNARAAQAHGIKVGAYHFLHRGDIAAQARHFVERVRAAGLGHGDLLPVVDVETVANGPSPTPADAAAFADAVQRQLNVRPLIYTFPFFAKWPSTFGCKLWIAHFDVRKPIVPKPVAQVHGMAAQLQGARPRRPRFL